MSLTGRTDTLQAQLSELDLRLLASRSRTVWRWIRRHRAAIEATITITLAMTTPVLAALATLQTSLTA
ncbi:MAG TPA: hypothetical protein VFE13_01015 [Caulobacteraceae bacterium]|jgi:hypothetical protein|nr:hypothetical protein [Caulobacteraceae bacterium]